MAGQTENYHIYYPTDYNEIADVPENDKQQALSIEEALALIDLRNIVGDLTQLETTIKTSIVEAINELKGETDDIGDLTQLETTIKTSVVAAINELKGKTDEIGDLTQLETTIKNDLVNAINELKTNTYNKTQTDTLLNGKQDTLESGTNIKTINNQSILGSGNINIQGGEGGGGTSDYTDLINKPSINNVTLSGNKTTSDLGLGTITSVKMNGSTISSSGEANLGTVITDVSDKQNITDNSLTTTNKTIPTAINEVNSIAKGANQALSYGNYSTMITAFNSLANNVYNVGQNVMIITLQVPDLWISGIESTSQTYTYTTDEAITTALETTGYVQVGYYKLSALETQKVDLIDYEQNTNKTTTISSSSTDIQYPSAKSVYDSQEEQNTEIEKLQTENARLKATLPTTTGEGEDVTLDKTAEMEFVKPPLPRGNSEQEGEPSPDNEVPITNVTGNVEVTISNNDNSESKTLPVSLGNIELCKLGNCQDYLYKNNGKWYKHNAINKLVLNGSENWSISNNVFYLASISDYINSSGKICLSDKYTAINNTDVGTLAITQNNSICFFITNTNPRLYIRDERFNNVNAFKAELSENNIKVYYPTVTPTDTEITDATLISQLEEISKALSYQGQTNITSDTIALFDVEAYQDLKIIYVTYDYIQSLDGDEVSY